MDQPRPQPLGMDGAILRTGTRTKLRQGQQDACHLTILYQVKVNLVVKTQEKPV